MDNNPENISAGGNPVWSESGQSVEENYAALDLLSVFRLFFKWWWVFVLVIGLACGLAYYLTKQTVPEYRAATIMEIKQKEAQVIDVSGVDQVDADREYLITQLALLRSRAISDRVVEALDLTKKSQFANQSLSAEAKIASASKTLSNYVSVSTLGNSRLISISVENESPSLAAQIADAYANSFVDYNLDKRFDSTSYAVEFVQDRLSEAKETLEQSERKLAQYADDTNIIDLSNGLGGSDQGVSDSLSGSALFTLNDQYDKTRSEALLFKQRYEQAKAGIDTEEMMSDANLAGLIRDRNALQAEYTEALKTYKPTFPKMRDLAAKQEYLNELIADQRGKLVSMFEARYREKETLAEDIQSRIRGLKGSIRQERNASIDYNILQREVETNRMQYEALLQRLNELTVTDGVGSNLVSIVEPATIPKVPFKPNLFRNLLAAVFTSGALVLLFVFIVEKLNDKIRTPEDAVRKLRMPVMGVIPIVKGGRKKSVKALSDPTSAISESFASLRSNLVHHLGNKKAKCIHVTSTRQDEGKSFAIVALARGFSDLNLRTLVIDADMRKPTMTVENKDAIGLAGLLSSTNERLVDHCVQTKRSEYLYLLPCGKIPERPSALIASNRFAEVLEEAKQYFDIVMVDSPPVLGLADAPAISSLCDGTIYVVECGAVHKKGIQMSLNRIKQTGGKVLGIVLNKYRSPSSRYLNYYYYAYGGDAYSYGNTKTKGSIFRRLFKKKSVNKKMDLGFGIE